MKPRLKKWRLLNRIRAFWGGYFWLPCPICGEYFGGHEWSETLWTSSCKGQKRGMGVCIDCKEKARRMNKKRGWHK